MYSLTTMTTYHHIFNHAGHSGLLCRDSPPKKLSRISSGVFPQLKLPRKKDEYFVTEQISAGLRQPQVPSCVQPCCHLDDCLHLPKQRCNQATFNI